MKVYLLINLVIQCVVWYYRPQNSLTELPLCQTMEEKVSVYCAARRTNIVLIKQLVNNCHFTIIPWATTIWFHGLYCVRSFPHSCRTLSDWGVEQLAAAASSRSLNCLATIYRNHTSKSYWYQSQLMFIHVTNTLHVQWLLHNKYHHHFIKVKQRRRDALFAWAVTLYSSDTTKWGWY